MKKLIVSILAVLYLGTTTGAPISLHYCMGSLADWDLGADRSKSCGKCGMDKNEEQDNGCCKDEHTFLKNDSDQKTAETSFPTLQLPSVALPVSFFEVPAADFPSVTEANPISHAPPRCHGVAVYIRHCVFLI